MSVGDRLRSRHSKAWLGSTTASVPHFPGTASDGLLEAMHVPQALGGGPAAGAEEEEAQLNSIELGFGFKLARAEMPGTSQSQASTR